MEVLLKPPPNVNLTTSMNLLFAGNPGTGKTTVAKLLAQIMVELKYFNPHFLILTLIHCSRITHSRYRKNPKPILTDVAEILSCSDPAALFKKMLVDAEGGTLFIDEVYLLDPAKKGQKSNDSNRVLDMLMQACVTMRDTTTFILAGQLQAIREKVLDYNVGMPSRFPKEFTFEFQDFTEPQLCKILLSMVKKDGLHFESKRDCGINIARVLSRRLHKRAGTLSSLIHVSPHALQVSSALATDVM